MSDIRLSNGFTANKELATVTRHGTTLSFAAWKMRWPEKTRPEPKKRKTAGSSTAKLPSGGTKVGHFQTYVKGYYIIMNNAEKYKKESLKANTYPE
ncbi:hypothetical protein PHYBLDRAFT_150563 [Phycomyces blakesleeanus NRRL 1555(-)]|uniref:Uncharacterized protein n=1 Tax=Phycomyces blakesleeanus (strain ATCC 8743b / DSM 1359 / FGSC 10004 / NBRC 33097 / NRRL 1555) TaxID=763407 RepID=A0A167KLT2_PHYB8|nr:hypothetical protein PHYBLDRAFT_150563 [Phycomyces blakesleeanus NRRL 1555(-)]OAD68386.1 hypothetical protein PHYBLDRAFT_150563 [Phycomyces blakesleeanus NRRL 1555(-)]|eukprot:XP_018286426.1 hypothetical protein PHYBLDRAFT_150563 [Phycomyces blakesleeanus NRRL 1555(-)]